MKSISALFLSLCAILSAQSQYRYQATPHLLKDINDATEGFYPRYPALLNNKVFFNGKTADEGRELWVTDGTASGTKMFLSINPGIADGPDENKKVSNGTVIVFVAYTPAAGSELWRTDGTIAGTYMLKDINPGPSASNVGEITLLNGNFLFRAMDNTNGTELWISDGTSNGTKLLKDIYSGNLSSDPISLTAAGNYCYFSARTKNEGYELWRSDGTNAGTILVKDINPGSTSSNVTNIMAYDSLILFQADSGLLGSEIFRSNGTAAGTRMVADLAVGSTSGTFYNGIQIGSKVLFNSYSSSKGKELYITDGTKSGTYMLKDIYTGSASSNPHNMFLYQNYVYFSANSSGSGYELWRSNGTDTGTKKFIEINAGSSNSEPNFFITGNNGFYFEAYNNSGSSELYHSDGTVSGTVKLTGNNAAIINHSFSVYCTIMAGSTLVFCGTDSNQAFQLAVSNGTASGTSIIGYYNPVTSGADLALMKSADDQFYFSATTNPYGSELYTTDGTAAGTKRISDLNPGAASSNPDGVINYKGKIWFGAQAPTKSGYSYQLCYSDGTLSGTKILGNGSDTFPQISGMPVVCNGYMYFGGYTDAYGFELWKSDGTAAGTSLVKDISPGSDGSYPYDMVALGNIVVFPVSNDPVNGTELWISDGTTSGTQLLKDISPGLLPSSPDNFTILNGKLYFSADDSTHGNELFVTDGTSANTKMLKDIAVKPNESSYPSKFQIFGNALNFVASDSNANYELYKTDGTSSGTKKVREINGVQDASILMFPQQANKLFFGAYSDTTGYEMWCSDGTAGGTRVTRELVHGNSGTSTVTNYFAKGNFAWFAGKDSANGLQLWSTDGSNAKSRLLCKLFPAVYNGSITDFKYFRHRLYFAANAMATGMEYYYVEPQPMVYNATDSLIPETLSNTSVADSTNFGQVLLNGPKRRTFVIRNVGIDTINLVSFSINGSSDFSVIATKKKILTEMDTAQIVVVAKPATQGNINADVQINWSVGSEAGKTYRFPVSANGVTSLHNSNTVKTPLVLAPNPATVGQNVQVTLPSEAQFWTLTDVSGKLVNSGSCSGKILNLHMDIGGSYFLRISTSSGGSYNSTIIVVSR